MSRQILSGIIALVGFTLMGVQSFYLITQAPKWESSDYLLISLFLMITGSLIYKRG